MMFKVFIVFFVVFFCLGKKRFLYSQFMMAVDYFHVLIETYRKKINK